MRINIELPDNLHRRLKIEAAEKGMTLKGLIIETLIEAVIDDPADWLALLIPEAAGNE